MEREQDQGAENPRETVQDGPDSRPFRRRRLKERPGFSVFGMRLLYRVLCAFFHCRVRWPEELENSEEPVVFIANHYNIFGPLSFVLSVPLVYSIWMNEELVNPESARVGIRPGLHRMLPFLSEKRVEWLSDKIADFISYVLRHVGMITVDRKSPAKLISTMRQSIAALEQGRHLLIFPETGHPEYSLTSVTPFFPGFAMLGKLYQRRTGKTLRFCPCYIDEQHRRIRLGELVTYSPEADSREETERVSNELNRRIREMAAENRGVEKEKGTPVRSTILFFCNLARLLLLIPLVTFLGVDNRQMILLFYGISQGIRILFNATCSVFASTNRLSFLISRGVGLLTDTGMMIYLAAREPGLRWVLYLLILNGAVFLISNVWNLLRYRRCAGVNYFDFLSANLLCVLCLQQLLGVQISGVVLGALTLATMVFLALSTGYTAAFNARIGQEEQDA